MKLNTSIHTSPKARERRAGASKVPENNEASSDQGTGAKEES